MIQKSKITKDEFYDLQRNRIARWVEDTTRWSNVICEIFEFEGRTYGATYEEPATEMQEGGDYDEVDVYPVKPVRKTVIEYVPVK